MDYSVGPTELRVSRGGLRGDRVSWSPLRGYAPTGTVSVARRLSAGQVLKRGDGLCARAAPVQNRANDDMCPLTQLFDILFRIPECPCPRTARDE